MANDPSKASRFFAARAGRPKLRVLMVGSLVAIGLNWGATGLDLDGSDRASLRLSSPWTEPTTQSWPAVNQWSPRLEDEYSQFVERLGQAVAQRRCHRLDLCLRDPAANLLFDPLTDPKLSIAVDCGDLPYVLRGYFSFKRRLPFGFVCEVHGIGADARYMSGVTPVHFCNWHRYKSPHAVLRDMTNAVHSGMYRMAPEVETSDFYPVAVNRRAVRPGTVYYDPNGHVLTVAEVTLDGTVRLMDGHPDGSLTWKRFGQAFALGGRGQGGGFKNFRPLQLVQSELLQTPNRELPWFDGHSQWDHTLWTASGQPGTYYSWVRQSLATAQTPHDPVADFRDQIEALCRDVSDRVEAVQQAVDAGMPARPHPAELPWNIYGTGGEWELYATPSRDARLKAAFRELYETVTQQTMTGPLTATLRTVWQEQGAQTACRFVYNNSAGTAVTLGLDDVLDRLFSLSFDAYHCPELRWGAPTGSAEAASCPDDAGKLGWYAKEQRLRNRIDRDYGAPTPLADGPEAPPELDLRRYLGIGR